MRDALPSFSTPGGRRALLRLTLGGAAIAAGSALLAACGAEPQPTPTLAPTVRPTAPPPTGASAPSASSGATASPLTATMPPVFTPAPAATTAPSAPSATASMGATMSSAMAAMPVGKLPSPGPNVPDAYVSLPAPFPSVRMTPGRGGKVSIVKASQQPPTVPREQNHWWLELEKRLGVTLDITLVPLPQYTEKATALIAAGTIPDILLISPLTAPDQYKAVQGGAFVDLTPYLTGEALKEYPNLARYPAAAWRNAMSRGKLWGVPRLSLATGPALLYRQDWAEKLGNPAPQDADAFLALMTAITKMDPDGNGKADTWGLGGQGADWSLPFIRGMYRVPNAWRKNADGSLTNQIETEEFRQALAYARTLFASGAYYPDAATLNRTQATQALIAGKIGSYADGLTQLNGDIRTRFEAKRVNPAANVAALAPMGFDGGKAMTYNGTGFGSLAAFPARNGADPARVKELLRLLDYYSAPIGSDEYAYLTFGIEGVDHERKPDGTRTLTDRGRAEIGELGTVVVPPPVFYFPSDPGDAQYLQGAAARVAALGIDNPALAAYSPTAAVKNAELNQLGTDRVTGIVTGRDPLAALDAYIADWRSRGGDQIRKELQQDLAG